MQDVRRTVNLGRGLVVPYAEPTSAAATTMGKANRRTDTKPEIRLRSALHRDGYRFRKDLLIRLQDVRARPDIVFTRAKVAVFVDGCFWHCCPDHHVMPKSNRDYWAPKFVANIERDRRVDEAFRSEGWTVLRVWEHETTESAVSRVSHCLRR